MITLARWRRWGVLPAGRGTTRPRLLAALIAVVLVTAATIAIAARPSGPGVRWAGELDGFDQPATVAPDQPEHPREPPRPRATPPAGRLPPQPPAGQPAPPPADPAAEFVGWAVLDLQTGTISGSVNLAATSTTASMVKAWIVADYLRLTTQAGNQPEPARVGQLSEIIRDSHNAYTEVVFHEIGAHASIERLIDICGLTDSSAVPNRWSNTRISARDTVRMGACLADGRAAGPEWTDWVLGEMRAVRGLGDFGIRHALPADQRAGIAIKNGWVPRTDQRVWHVSCLAIGDRWTMGVLTQYPEELGLAHGAEICRSLAAQHLT